MSRPACPTPGWSFRAGLGFQPWKGSSKWNVQSLESLSYPGCDKITNALFDYLKYFTFRMLKICDVIMSTSSSFNTRALYLCDWDQSTEDLEPFIVTSPQEWNILLCWLSKEYSSTGKVLGISVEGGVYGHYLRPCRWILFSFMWWRHTRWDHLANCQIIWRVRTTRSGQVNSAKQGIRKFTISLQFIQGKHTKGHSSKLTSLKCTCT